jgi:hypothetical protein
MALHIISPSRTAAAAAAIAADATNLSPKRPFAKQRREEKLISFSQSGN